METIGAYEAKTYLSKLLERVAQGQSFTITKHGVPIAVLQPVESNQVVDRQSVIAQLHRFRVNHYLHGLTIREMIEDGQR